MTKRVLSVFLCLILALTGISIRLIYIATNPIYAAEEKSLRVRTIAEKRGNIYDRSFQPLVNDETQQTACIIPCNESYEVLKKLKGESFAKETIGNGYLTTIQLESNQKLPPNKNHRIFETYKRYSHSTALHLLGYTDSDGNGVSGIEKYYNNELKAMGGTIKIAYRASATEKMLADYDIEIRDNNYYSPEGIVLTIDKTIQKIAEKAMENNNITKGAVIVLETESSAILAIASTPLYGRENIEDYLNDENAPFINRAITAYPVGSVFKPITAAAALESNISLRIFNCNGSITKSGNTFNCNKKEGHGNIDFNEALSLSCNPYFIDLSTKIPAEKLLATAKSLGLGKAINFGNGFLSDSGVLPNIKELNSEAAIGNFGFGQGKLTATPLQIAQCFSVIACGGIYKEPFLIKGTVNSSGAFQAIGTKSAKRILKESTCRTISYALKETTVSGTGENAFSSLFNSCTKTATAESGQFDKNGNEIKYCWFAGYFPAENPKYTICILKENGSSGGIDGAPVFKEIAEKIYISER